MSVGLRTLVLLASLATVATLIGCTSPMAGAPTTATGASETSASQIPADGESPTPSVEPSFSNTQLCGLLTTEEAIQLGGSSHGEPRFSTMDGHPQCLWGNETSLVVGFQENGASGSDPAGPGVTNTPTTVAGYAALQSLSTDPVEICQVLVDLTDKAVLGVSVATLTRGEGKYVPCDVAKALAEIVVPKAMKRWGS